MDSTAQTAHGASEIINESESLATRKSSTKLLQRVTHAFESANSPNGLRNLHRKCFHWGRMHLKAQTAPAAQKSSSKMLPLGTHALDSANSPCGFRNLQRNCFHW
jgi:hypothetical protein